MTRLGQPTACPHGNPIPGTDYVAPPALVPLGTLDVNTDFTVHRIPEELEFTDGMLDFLERSSITPGTRGKVIESAPDGTTTLSIGEVPVGIGEFAAARILVSPDQRTSENTTTNP